MKLLTLNTHSLIDEDYKKNLKILANAIRDELPHVIALQEVNQSRTEPTLAHSPFVNDYCVRADNYGCLLLNLLDDIGIKYHGFWLPSKIGYDKFDEGTALLSREEILETDDFLISASSDYSYWKTRRVLGIRNRSGWFYSVHMGWWQDEEEPFLDQWKRLDARLSGRERVWLMGDFNSSAEVRGEGYDAVIGSGWYDSYALANIKDDGYTIAGEIDGWRNSTKKRRIDYIFSNFLTHIKSSEVIFNGRNREVISDHFGVMIETEE